MVLALKMLVKYRDIAFRIQIKDEIEIFALSSLLNLWSGENIFFSVLFIYSAVVWFSPFKVKIAKITGAEEGLYKA